MLQTIRLVKDGDPAADAVIVNVGSAEEALYRERGYREPQAQLPDGGTPTRGRRRDQKG